MLKKGISSFNRQIHQLREGGVQILYKKIKKAFWLLFMNILAPLAIFLKINWPESYYFIGKKNLRKLKGLRGQPNVNELTIKKIENQTIEYFKAIVDREPALINERDWIDVSRALGDLYFLQGRMDHLDDLCQRTAEVQRKIAKTHQLDGLGIEFLPRYLPVGSIGNYEHLEAYLKAGMLGLLPAKKLISLIDSQAAINNPCYLRYWSRYITVVSDPLLVEMLTPVENGLTIPLNLYMPLHEKIHKSFLALGVVRDQWIKEERLPIFTLSDEDYARGWQCLKSFGMQQDDWFVCLHVRGRGWRGDHSAVEDFRNSDIHAYKLAIKAVTDAGGWVIRMGDPAMKPLPQMPRVIDYAHSDAKSDWMDVFLCAQCRFLIGTSSGLFNFAIAFGIPVVTTNFLPTCCAYYLTSNDLFIPRICWSKDENRLLNFAELFSPAMGTAAVQCHYDHKNIKILENSEEEIKDVVEEMLERCSGRLKYSEEDEELQKRFKSMTLDCGKGYGEENAVVNARMGRSFLRKYAALLSSEDSGVKLGYGHD